MTQSTRQRLALRQPGLRDAKSLGVPPMREPMSPGMRRAVKCMLVVIAIGTAYGVVVDEADRMVLMSRAEFERHVAAQRIQAAQEMAEAIDPGTCGWRDLFDPRRQPKRSKGPM